MKKHVIDFLHTLNLYDYLLFGGIIFFFLLLLILSIIFRHKQVLAISLVLVAFITLLIAPIGGYIALHELVYSHAIKLTTAKDLTYTEALLVQGEINNTSQQTFKECTIYIGVSKISPIKPLNKLYTYVPFRRQTIVIKGPIEPKGSEVFKLLIQPFHYNKRHSVTALGQCK